MVFGKLMVGYVLILACFVWVLELAASLLKLKEEEKR